MKRVTTGITRTVFLIGNYAIKVPCGRYGLAKWLRGRIANLQEREWSQAQKAGVVRGLCPVLLSDPFGFFVIMPRVRTLPRDLSPDGYEMLVDRGDYRIPAENKADSFGILKGAIVAIDYGN